MGPLHLEWSSLAAGLLPRISQRPALRGRTVPTGRAPARPLRDLTDILPTVERRRPGAPKILPNTPLGERGHASRLTSALTDTVTRHAHGHAHGQGATGEVPRSMRMSHGMSLG